MNKRLWILLLVACLVAAAIGGAKIYVSIHKPPVVRISIVEVKKEISNQLPAGSSRIAVESYLTKEGIEHSYTGDSKYPPEYQRTEMATIRNSSSSWLIRGDIQIIFHFDQKDKLVTWSAKELFTGP